MAYISSARGRAPRGRPRIEVMVMLVALASCSPGDDTPSPGGASLAAASFASASPASGSEGVPNDPRVILITGSTSGLGREVARELAAGGAHVIVHGRNQERGAALVREIEEAGIGSARFYAADFASLEAVRAFATAIQRDYDRLDVLVNNAGVLLLDPPERRVSADGYELHFQVNYLSGFLLTRLLLPMLRESAPARIVNVSSLAAAPLDFGNIMLEEAYSPGRAYGQSKLAQVMLTFDLAAALEGSGVTVNALHPATMMDTPMLRSQGLQPRTSVREGAEALLRLINAPDLGTGRYFIGLEPGRAHEQAYDEQARAELRALSRRLTGM